MVVGTNSMVIQHGYKNSTAEEQLNSQAPLQLGICALQ